VPIPNGVEKYLKLVEHDLRLLDLLTKERSDDLATENFTDWQATLLFYMACIYLKAVCLTFGEDIQDHFSLRQQINARKELAAISAPYRHLEEASRDARYEGRTFDRQYLLERLLPKFLAVRDCAVSLLERGGIKNVPRVDPTLYLLRNA